MNGCSCHCSEIWSVCSTKKGMRAVEESDCDGVKEGFQMLASATSQQEPLDPSCLHVIGFAMSYKNGALIVVCFCDNVDTDSQHAVLVSSVDVREVPVPDHHDFAGLNRGPQRDCLKQSVWFLEVMADDSYLQLFLDGLSVQIAPIVVRALNGREREDIPAELEKMTTLSYPNRRWHRRTVSSVCLSMEKE